MSDEARQFDPPAEAADRAVIRRARKNFAAMAGSYCLGVFNDNFFKEVAMLWAAATTVGVSSRAGGVDGDVIQVSAVALFSLPYILFAGQVGWLADRFPKRTIAIGAKLLEVAAMICGAVGVYTGSWALMLTMVFTMALQSAIFGPALNGSIPELYPAWYVPRANAILKGAVTAGILLGVFLAGQALGENRLDPGHVPTARRLLVGAVVLAVAAVGVLASLGVPRRPAADPNARFPRAGPWRALKLLNRTRRQDRLLTITIAADVFVWAVGSLLIFVIHKVGLSQFNLSKPVTSLVILAELLGIVVGGFLASALAGGRRWYRVLPPAALAMGLAMLLVALLPLGPAPVRLPGLFVLVALTGAGGGLFMIPCESFIQVRPAAGEKGAVIASSNLAVFTGMLLTGGVFLLLKDLRTPTLSFALTGGACLAAAWALRRGLRKVDESCSTRSSFSR